MTLGVNFPGQSIRSKRPSVLGSYQQLDMLGIVRKDLEIECVIKNFVSRDLIAMSSTNLPNVESLPLDQVAEISVKVINKLGIVSDFVTAA